jgi:hypothetical protein
MSGDIVEQVATSDGLLSAEEIQASVEHLVQLQQGNGMVLWNEGGHCDPWNHVESAMAMSLGGKVSEVEAAYAWLADTQLGNGAWFNYYRTSGVKDQRIDTNVCAYVALGLFHHAMVTGSEELLAKHRVMVEQAIDFVLESQKVDGTIAWSIDATGRRESYALLTGSSSILLSLRAAIAAWELLGLVRPDWELAACRLAHAISHHPGAFAPKREFAMDWYYPVLSGALSEEKALARVDLQWADFVIEDLGVRCVSTEPWITAAETAECAMALASVGRRIEAQSLLTTTRRHRLESGAYLTGIVYPEKVSFPSQETSSYTAAAVVLAHDVVRRSSNAWGILGGHGLPLVQAYELTDCCSENA